jgi:predicted nucleotidyltransferase
MQKPSGMLILPLNRTPFKTDFEAIAREIVLRELLNADCRIFLFGSRARKDNHRFSDMDIGIVPGKNFNERILYILRDKLNDSIVPFKVEVVNFNYADKAFKQEALKDAVYWN